MLGVQANEMKPIFTVHAGEYLAGSALEELFPALRVWMPTRDSGVDLLVTDDRGQKALSLQVKFSKDFLGNNVRAVISKNIKSGGWWTFKRDKIAESPADYWVLVLYQFQQRSHDFIIISPTQLLRMYNSLGRSKDVIQSYVWVTQAKPARCWETRGLKKADEDSIADDSYSNRIRELTKYLNNWKPIARLLKHT
jgi:hypothetical protein